MSIRGWEKIEEVNIVRYKFLSQEESLSEVEINSKYGMDAIIFKGKCTEKIYALMKEKLEQRFTEESSGNISLSDKNIWICVREIYLANEAELGPVLDKVYKAVESLFPQFSQIRKEIDNTIAILGNKKGLDYFNLKKIVPVEKINQKSLTPIEEFDKLVPENCWKKIEKEDVTRFQFTFQRGPLSEVEINGGHIHLVILKGPDTEKIYKLIEKSDIDKRCLKNISLICENIWIWTKRISEDEVELRSVLDRVYNIVESLFPQFSQITKEIDSTLVVLGNKEGLDYFNQKTPSSIEKFNQISLIPIEEFDKLVPENCWKKIDSAIIALGKNSGLDYLSSLPASEIRKKYWRSYMNDKVRRFKSAARPNPLPCTGCWGVKQRSSRLSPYVLKKIQETILKLAEVEDRPSITYKEGDWGDWSGYPQEKWSTEANFVRKHWRSIFLKQDQRSDDIENGFIRSSSQSDNTVERIMGFSCEDLNSPLSSVYFIKQRGGAESIAMTLFAKEGKIKEFEEWLRNIDVIPVFQPLSPSSDEYRSDYIDPAFLYTPAAFYNSEKGIFGSLIAKDIECLRRILTEHHYQIESSFLYAFNNICHSQTGVSKFILPD